METTKQQISKQSKARSCLQSKLQKTTMVDKPKYKFLQKLETAAMDWDGEWECKNRRIPVVGTKQRKNGYESQEDPKNL